MVGVRALTACGAMWAASAAAGHACRASRDAQPDMRLHAQHAALHCAVLCLLTGPDARREDGERLPNFRVGRGCRRRARKAWRWSGTRLSAAHALPDLRLDKTNSAQAVPGGGTSSRPLRQGDDPQQRAPGSSWRWRPQRCSAPASYAVHSNLRMAPTSSGPGV